MSFEWYFGEYGGQLEDFWGRRRYGSAHSRAFRIFGRSIRLSSNEARLLEAADFSRPLYSSAPDVDDKSFQIEVVVRPFQPAPGPLPDNLFDHIQYTGRGSWLAMQMGGWGHCQIDLASGKALAILSTEFGCQPEAVSRFLLNTILNNFMKSVGLGMVHTTAVYRDGRLLMMLAPHNSGKSTTALHLTLAGYAFVSDSQIYIDDREAGLRLYGFPVGRAKLRRDMLPNFPRLQAFLAAEPVRRETKFRLDLHEVDPALVYDAAIEPEGVVLCLLSRNGREKTTLSGAEKEEALAAAMVNSLYYDEPENWRRNFEQIERLVGEAACYHLSIGTDAGDIVRVVDGLMG